MAESSVEEIPSEVNSDELHGERTVLRRHRKVAKNDQRPPSLEIETDWTNTETKLVVLDFLSNQPVEKLSARNVPNDRARKVCKSSSDGSSHESYRRRYAKLARTAKPLRKQYSLRLKKDLDEYLRQRGKSLDDLPSYSDTWSNADHAQDSGLMHQRSYTEGDRYFHYLGGTRRRISDDLKKSITEFNQSRLKHVADDDKTGTKCKKLRHNRPENLDISFQSEQRISPVLSPESQVAARLEYISQDILNKYPNFFDEQISKVSLQELTYEKFASVARKVLEKYPGGWTRVALVCYFARELALEDESTDEELDNLVGFSSRFISETSAEWIASQGGWRALEENEEVLSPAIVRKKLREQPDLVDGILHPGTTMDEWLYYLKRFGLAALAVGMTVAYSMSK